MILYMQTYLFYLENWFSCYFQVTSRNIFYIVRYKQFGRRKLSKLVHDNGGMEFREFTFAQVLYYLKGKQKTKNMLLKILVCWVYLFLFSILFLLY